MKQQQQNKTDKAKQDSNSNLQGIDKAPGEEQGKKEKVTPTNLKGKKVDGDPEEETDKPLNHIP
jgi:hypothetical protein